MWSNHITLHLGSSLTYLHVVGEHYFIFYLSLFTFDTHILFKLSPCWQCFRSKKIQFHSSLWMIYQLRFYSHVIKKNMKPTRRFQKTEGFANLYGTTCKILTVIQRVCHAGEAFSCFKSFICMETVFIASVGGLEDFGLATENFGSHSLRLRTLLTAPKFVHCHGSHWRTRRAEINLYYIYNIVYPLGMALREKNVDSEMRTKKNKRRWIKLEDKNKNKNYWMSWRQWKKSYINTRRNITGKKTHGWRTYFFFFIARTIIAHEFGGHEIHPNLAPVATAGV